MHGPHQPPPRYESYTQIVKIGAVGSFMQDPRHRACPSQRVSLESGLDFMNRQVRHILSLLEHIDQYIEDTGAQENVGWWLQ